MRIIKETKAISIIFLILLLSLSAIVGGLITYMWVMSAYYNMPENTTMLIVEDISYTVFNFTHFNVTILNPSNSVLDANITSIKIHIEDKNETLSCSTTEPALPFNLTRGTRQSFKCLQNWSNYSGSTVRIEPVALEASTKSYPYVTPRARMEIRARFDETDTVKFFNLSINTFGSDYGLNISKINLFGESLNEKLSPPLAEAGSFGPTEIKFFWVERNWENLRGQNVTLTLETVEGYKTSYTTDKLPGAIMEVSKISFDYADTSYINVTVSNAEDATASAVLNALNLTLSDNTTIPLVTFPPLNVTQVPVAPNSSITLRCLWNWNDHRNETITVTALTKQEFSVANKTVTTPPSTVWEITEAKFDLDDVMHFTVNVTNTPCSLGDVNITRILLNNQNTTMDPPFAVIANGTHATLTCGFNWTSLRGQTANITVFSADGKTATLIVMLPSVGLKVVGDSFVFGDLPIENSSITVPYINVTISNSANSLYNVTLNKITVEAANKTYVLDNALMHPTLSPDGYNLTIGESLTIICLSDYTAYLFPPSIKVTVYTSEGFQTSKTFTANP
ncbi:MAG: hypothetical protein QXJ02_00920 [Candidatus Bathyarchaeia archaeon]